MVKERKEEGGKEEGRRKEGRNGGRRRERGERGQGTRKERRKGGERHTSIFIEILPSGEFVLNIFQVLHVLEGNMSNHKKEFTQVNIRDIGGFRGGAIGGLIEQSRSQFLDDGSDDGVWLFGQQINGIDGLFTSREPFGRIVGRFKEDGSEFLK